MGAPTMLDFSRLVTPTAHGDVLIEPDPQRMRESVEANRRLLNTSSIRLMDRELRECRAEVRKGLCGGGDHPVILVGHQPEFIHAGVWAKQVVAGDLAVATGGVAVNLVVDSDVPKSTSVDVPGMDGGRATWRPARYTGVATGTTYESMPAVDAAQRSEFAEHLRTLMGEMFDRSSMPLFLASWGDAADWVDQWIAARQAVDRQYAAAVLDRRISGMWLGPFFGELLANAGTFAACYNGALDDYRRKFRVRSPQRPIPDLALASSRVELPVWAHRQGDKRRRLIVERRPGAIGLFAENELITEMAAPALLSWDRLRDALEGTRGYRFRPRALALTLWARLVAGDLFIHGIGGAKYDRIADEIIRRYFKVAPPAMGCVSATLMINVRAPRAEPTRLAELVYRRRDARFNPQRYVPRTGRVQELMSRRLAAVAESERLRREAPTERERRREVFRSIRTVNDELAAANRTAIADAEHAVAREWEAVRSIAAARRRDFFYAMAPAAELQRLRKSLGGGNRAVP